MSVDHARPFAVQVGAFTHPGPPVVDMSLSSHPQHQHHSHRTPIFVFVSNAGYFSLCPSPNHPSPIHHHPHRNISRTPQQQHQRALPLQSLIVFLRVRYIASFVPTTVFSYPLFSYPLLLCVSYIDDIVSAVPSYLAVSPLSLFFLPFVAALLPYVYASKLVSLKAPPPPLPVGL